ncbi:coenzyme F420-0:L-glutamate ligase [Arcanobacterium canis]
MGLFSHAQARFTASRNVPVRDIADAGVLSLSQRDSTCVQQVSIGKLWYMIEIFPVHTVAQIAGGDDIAAVIGSALNSLENGEHLRGADIVAIAGKIVAKAQGRWHKEGAEPDGFRTRAGIPQKLGLKAPVDPDDAASQIRRGLAARFGGRAGVLITASSRSGADIAIGRAGVDHSTDAGAPVADALAALAGTVMELENTPVVVIRGLEVLTWED